ncbi:hypothetical protein [Tautonia sociabilis]|uniref:Uncharacterized protein n=1 Tax=Tautonia sociabilis TaxID=2080755 RepID=A0A432MKJ8_9BACT|nr:hypothetical protein [Tautonia sociabilis]RUL87737.1 hypothetical protein TsocGM_11180 [Tautonia sociabilis]
MSAPRIGLALRLIGPILEFSCIALVLRGPARNRETFGMEVEPLLYAGLALGLAMVAVGLSLSVVPRRGRRRLPDRGAPPPG